MNLLRNKMFVSNWTVKRFSDQKCKKCYLNRENTFISTREIQEKTEEKLSASLGCISLVSIYSFATLINKIIYNVQTLPQL